MKAVRIHSYGGTEVLAYEDAPRPSAGDGELVIRVMATSVNPFDAAVRAGYMSSYFNHNLPLILGTDAAGVVDEVGAGVEDFAIGDQVYARGGVVRDGAYAQYMAISVSDLALKPESVDFQHSAAIPHVTLIAWQALFELASLSKGQTVLIHGAGGGVGHIAIQLAKSIGAKVIGTASKNIDFVRGLDVDEAIDYSTTKFEEVTDGVDVVLDTVGGDTQQRSWSVIKPGGILVSTIEAPSEETAAAHGVRSSMVFSAPPIGPTLTKVAKMIDSGEIKPEVSMVFPLDDVRTAHEMIEGRHTRGKMIIQVAE